MKIISVNTIQSNKPAFGSCFRFYIPKAEKYNCFESNLVRNSTNVFREDLDWVVLVQYLKTHFADKEKVNSYSLACSDGSEAYSFAISILELMPQKLQYKFFPIIASDIDEEIIKIAKSGRININNIEFLMSERHTNIDIGKYFKDRDISIMVKNDIISETDTISSYVPIKKIKEVVQFKKSDILTELQNIKDNGNSVIMCRNVFPYLNSKYIDEIIKAAKNNLKDGSIFIIGDYDGGTGIEEKLLCNGFFQPLLDNNFIHGNNVFQRKTSDEIKNKLYSGYLI